MGVEQKVCHGLSCARAERLSMIVDAARYYAVLRESILRAERRVFILGWDVDTRTVLDPEPSDGYPAALLEFLNQVLSEKPELRVYVLAWDFSVIYAHERERMPSHKFASRAHPRLAFALDGRHQVGASHHQKLVVIDDALAFCGGIDLTIRRWDTEAHEADAVRRVDPFGEPYAPMHDVQLAVSGPIARELSALCLKRWLRATDEALTPPRASDEGPAPWPRDLPAALEDVEVAIARTEPSDSERHRDVREVEQVTLRAIARAQRTIFIENQYFTATAVGDALIAQLERARGPEVILVLPRNECGWLEQSSMGVLRERMLSRLRRADRYHRLHAVYPQVPGLGEACVNVHSKLLIVDDLVCKIGSANMSNRSLGLDTECDLVLEAAEDDARVREAIAGFRRSLLAEHLGCSEAEIAEHEAKGRGLGVWLEARRKAPRTLLPLPAASDAPLDLSALEQFVVDPERPMAADAFIAKLLPSELRSPLRRMLLALLLSLAPALALALGVRSMQAGETSWLSLLLEFWDLAHRAPAPLLQVVTIVLCLSAALCPITLWIPLCILTFGASLGSLYALSAALCSVSVFYALGRVLGHVPLSYLRGPQMAKLRAELRRSAFSATLAARLFPLGNFTLINLLAGALYVPFSAFFFANVLGLSVGIVGTAICTVMLFQLVMAPSLTSLLGFSFALLLSGLALFLLGHWLHLAGRSRDKGALRYRFL